MTLSQIAKIINSDSAGFAVSALKENKVIGLPTETVYGLAGNAFSTEAITKIFSVKERPSFDPLIVHVKKSLNSVEKLDQAKIIDQTKFSKSMIEITNALISKFWPGPLTLVLPKNSQIPDLVTSGLNQVGVRMPRHPIALQILDQFDSPLAAPSANRFGRISPTTAQHVFEELGDRIDWIVNGGPCEIGLESTVIAVDDGKIWLLRPGKISIVDISLAAGVPVLKAPTEHEKASPGMLASHYAPRKNMFFLDNFLRNLASSHNRLKSIDAKSFGLLIVTGNGNLELNELKKHRLIPSKVVLLSDKNDPEEVARNMFASMRQLDASDVEFLICSPVNNQDGLWGAIADRLNRASTQI